MRPLPKLPDDVLGGFVLVTTAMQLAVVVPYLLSASSGP